MQHSYFYLNVLQIYIFEYHALQYYEILIKIVINTVVNINKQTIKYIIYIYINYIYISN